MLEHPVPDPILTKIGDIAVSFAFLEDQIEVLAWSQINEHQRAGQVITVELSFRSLRALVLSLYRERRGDDEDFIVLRDLMVRAADLEDRRNQIFHSLWAAGGSADSVTRFKSSSKEKHGITFQSEQVDAAILADVGTQIKTLAHEIQGFWLHLLETGKGINNPIAPTW